jgi:hypothetical protein
LIDIKSETGHCKKCGKVDLLGNGFCVLCWDNRNRPVKKDKSYQKYVSKTCASCGRTIQIQTRYNKKHNYCTECNRKKRFVGKPAKEFCPHCKTNHTRKHGIFNNRQLYKCDNCGKSFLRVKDLLKGGLNRDKVRVHCRRCGGIKLQKRGFYRGYHVIYCKDCRRTTYVSPEALH